MCVCTNRGGTADTARPTARKVSSMQAERTERKYVMTKVGAGDYLLPSNDAKTIWRIMKYEDGPSHGIVEGMDRDEMFWGIWRWTGRVPGDTLDPDDWDLWEMYDGSCASRAEAVRVALAVPPR